MTSLLPIKKIRSDETSDSILGKAFELLGCFTAEERALTLTEIAQASGLAKSTVHRLLGRLIAVGAVERHGLTYALGVRLFEFGSRTPVAVLRELAVPHLVRLSRWSGATAQVGVLREDDLVILDQIGPLVARATLPWRFPAADAALGQVLLAWEPGSAAIEPDLDAALSAIRAERAARSSAADEVSLAVPIIALGSVVAAIGLTAHSDEAFSTAAETALRGVAGALTTGIQAFLRDGGRRWFPRAVS